MTRHPLAGYAGAAFVCALSAAADYFLQPLLGDRAPLAVFPVGVVVAAWYGGFGPGLLVTLVGSALGARFQGDDPAHGASLLLFTLVGLLISIAVRQLREQTDAERDTLAETERQLHQTNRLRQLTATLSRARTPDDVVDTCLPDMLHGVDSASGAVLIAADEGGEWDVVRAIGYDEARLAAMRRFTPPPDSALATAIRRRELVTNGDVVVPLVVAGRAIGAVTLDLPRGRPPSGDEREFLINAARHTAQALDRARLYESSERARADAEAFRARADAELTERQRMEEALRLSEAKYRALAARTSRLHALSAGLSEAASVDDVAAVIVREGRITVGASDASITLRAEGETPPPGLCSTTAIETRRPVFIGSFAEWQEKYPRSASAAADGGFASAATLPLLADKAVLGVLEFMFTAPVNFDEEYQALLTSVAQHCAQALDRARLYETAERARADAEAANRSKDDFLSTISHELRTPLNAMLGWAAMLRTGSVEPARTRRAIDAIYNNATRQAHLIEELLDVSRIVAGRATFDLQEVDLGENLAGAVEAMMPLAAQKDLELRCAAAKGVRVTADPRRLEQVFLNLVSNAVKFTPAGGRISVEVMREGSTGVVRVTDTGAGIDEAFLPHVFDRFRQADGSPTRAAGGLGLGLYIARHLIEAQGGSIRVESDGPGHGATFTVTLPARSAEDTPRRTPSAAAEISPETPSRPALSGVRVLVVDDEPDAREVMVAALEECGATVVSAASAGDALEALSHGDVDLLLADIAMPGRDGYELIRDVRAMPSSRIATIPAAAVTAHARDDERARALDAGFQMHLTKPVEPTALARAVAILAADARRSSIH